MEKNKAVLITDKDSPASALTHAIQVNTSIYSFMICELISWLTASVTLHSPRITSLV